MVLMETQTFTRATDLTYLAKRIVENECCAIIGISNIGKSSLLRRFRDPGLLPQISPVLNEHDYSFIYIDFNLQLQMTGQGFYELVLRSILTELKNLQAEERVISQIEDAYRQIIAPTDDFQNALSFNQAIITLCEQWPRRLVLLFDEFDEVFRELESRVFLNLRALRDKYPMQLMYIVVVGTPLLTLRNAPAIAEFVELFSHHTYYLHSLERKDVEQIVRQFAIENEVQFSAEDIAFIAKQSGGHPGLLETVCQVLASNTVAGVTRDARIVLTHLADNPNIRLECIKLWNNLTVEKQQALLNLVRTNQLASPLKQALLKEGILTTNGQGQLVIFGRLFEEFVQRQQLLHNAPQQGITIDIEAGQVYVDGHETETLTNLEYRLLLLLYGQMNKICDKYRIVEAVWGEDYIEEVDDARIEKLVSRLRQKIEPYPSEPKYLVTVRGRGYRLQSN